MSEQEQPRSCPVCKLAACFCNLSRPALIAVYRRTGDVEVREHLLMYHHWNEPLIETGNEVNDD